MREREISENFSDEKFIQQQGPFFLSFLHRRARPDLRPICTHFVKQRKLGEEGESGRERDGGGFSSPVHARATTDLAFSC